MSHLTRSGPIRRSRAIKRTALIEVITDEQAANELTFEQLEAECAADARAIVAQREEFFRIADALEPSASQKAAREANAAQRVELDRMTNGGFIHG